MDGIRKKIEGAKGKWPLYLDEILWAYRAIPRTATNRSPYELAFGMEAVTPIELLVPSPRVACHELTANREGKLLALDSVDELREEARLRMTEYQRKVKKAFDKRVAPRHFQRGDLVLRKVEATGKKVDKLDPAWEGPFEVVRGFEGRAYQLATMERVAIPRSWNAEHLRRFYA